MQFRMGMRSGEVVVAARSTAPDNIAARLERLARPFGICISELVRMELEDTPPLEDIGPQFVKNIPHPIHAFFVDVEGQELPVRPKSSSWPAIAVLPFETAEGDGDAEYLADGVTEDLVMDLAMWHQFPVIARNSTFTYKGRIVEPVLVGTELGAEYLVVGSLRRLGERVRISVQLLDAEAKRRRDGPTTTIAHSFRRVRFPGRAERACQAPGDLTAWDAPPRVGTCAVRPVGTVSSQLAAHPPSSSIPTLASPTRTVNGTTWMLSRGWMTARWTEAPATRAWSRPDGGERLPVPVSRLLGAGQARRGARESPSGG
jgi:TolB-like protein